MPYEVIPPSRSSDRPILPRARRTDTPVVQIPASKEADVAVGVLRELPGVNEKQYQQVSKKLFGQHPAKPDRAPDGMLLHSAGPHRGGWYVYDIWETADQFRRFDQEKLAPAVQEIAGDGLVRPEPQFFEISSLVQSN